VVAVASAPPCVSIGARRADRVWTVSAAAVLLAGLVVRLLVGGGGGVGDRSAMVMTALLAVAGWLAARLLAGPRAALLAMVGIVALLDLAALPARNPPEYDDLEAFYRTDQVLTAQLAVPSSRNLAITVLARPVFDGARAQFGLAGEVNGSPQAWTCAFTRGVQRIALPLSIQGLVGTADVRLHLSGSPTRESEYLVVYASSKLGGFVLGLQPLASLDPSVTRCSPA
jgi:hypothetical protein